MLLPSRKLLIWGFAAMSLMYLLILRFLFTYAEKDVRTMDGSSIGGLQKKTRVAQGRAESLHLLLRTQGERRSRWRERCQGQRKGQVLWVYVDFRHDIAYCQVPKVGSTFWVNVFKFFVNNTGGAGVASPMEISRVHTHYGSYERVEMFSFPSRKVDLFRNNSLRFMFVRDPFRRLWSAYVDKFLLPDFWQWPEAKQIILRRKGAGHSQEEIDRMLQCPDDISFREFVSFVAQESSETTNLHWRPIKQICDPCLFRPHILGTMETFGPDATSILDMIGEGWITKSKDHRGRVLRELAMLIDYNFWALQTHTPRGCLTSQGLARRLWTAFALNGYLSPASPEQVQQLANVSLESFKRLVLQAYREEASSPETEQARRVAAFQTAFGAVRRSDMLKLMAIYEDDMELFGYGQYPKSVLGEE